MISTRVVLGRWEWAKGLGKSAICLFDSNFIFFFAVEENPMELLEKLLWRVVCHWIRDTYLLEV